jgi:hypothetical protein
MAKRCPMRYALVVVLALCAGTSRAALLAEVGINIRPTTESLPPTNSLGYSFIAGSIGPPTVSGVFARQVTAADIGMTFEAPPDILDAIARALARPANTAGLAIHIYAWQYSRPLDQLQDGGFGYIDDTATFRKFVPDITKVPVNRVTMTINSYVLEPFSPQHNRAVVGGSHTIRIYGVPEPASAVLMLGAVAYLIGRRPERFPSVPNRTVPGNL